MIGGIQGLPKAFANEVTIPGVHGFAQKNTCATFDGVQPLDV